MRQVIHEYTVDPNLPYDLQAARTERKATDTAIIRVEQLYPFPAEILTSLLVSYAGLADAAWVQEEPQNMGPSTFIEPRLRPILAPSVQLRYVGRPPSASPATGNATVHKRELAAVLLDAFDQEATKKEPITRLDSR